MPRSITTFWNFSQDPGERFRSEITTIKSNFLAELRSGGRIIHLADTRANEIFVTLEFLYGFAPAKTDALKRIVKP